MECSGDSPLAKHLLIILSWVPIRHGHRHRIICRSQALFYVGCPYSSVIHLHVLLVSGAQSFILGEGEVNLHFIARSEFMRDRFDI